jgi:hypothetical protein
MADVPTGRARPGLTRRRLALLAILVLGSAGGVGAYAMREPGAPASAEREPAPAAAASPPGSEPARPGAVPSATRLPSAPAVTSPPRRDGTPAPDSAVDPDPAVADPASGTPAPPPDGRTPPACRQWRRLSDDQRMSYSMTLLRAAWTSAGSAAIPPENTVRSYRSAITAACLGRAKEDDNVPDIARVVYAADPGKWGP